MGVAGWGGCSECESSYLFACAARHAQWAVARCCFYKYLRILIKIQLVGSASLCSVRQWHLPVFAPAPSAVAAAAASGAWPGQATWAPLSEWRKCRVDSFWWHFNVLPNVQFKSELKPQICHIWVHFRPQLADVRAACYVYIESYVLGNDVELNKKCS